MPDSIDAAVAGLTGSDHSEKQDSAEATEASQSVAQRLQGVASCDTVLSVLELERSDGEVSILAPARLRAQLSLPRSDGT